MKKILSLAIILSCAFTSASWADGPGGNSHGQQQVWQQDADRGGPGATASRGRRPTTIRAIIIRGTVITVARIAAIKGAGARRMIVDLRRVMSRITLRGTGTISAKVSRLRNVSAVMIIGLTTGTIADYRHHRAGSTGRILTATMC